MRCTTLNAIIPYMNRTQKVGKQTKWTLEDIKRGFELFYKEQNRYPTSQELDNFEFLPSSRSIQRRFGGLVSLRKELKLTGSSDYTKGEHSSKRAQKINERAHRVEHEVHEYLSLRFGVEFVHREFFFTDDRRTRTDFFIYCGNGNFLVDVFYPDNRHNLIGCLNSKMRIYGREDILQYPVIFLQMNKDITQEELDDIVEKKKNKLQSNQKLLCIGKFKEFCKTKHPRKTV